MSEWRNYGSERKDNFEQGLYPRQMADTLAHYQKELGSQFGVRELLELEKIKALALIAEAINDAPEFLVACAAVAVDEGILSSVPESLIAIADAISEGA